MIFLSLSAHFHMAQSDFLSLCELTFPEGAYIISRRDTSSRADIGCRMTSHLRMSKALRRHHLGLVSDLGRHHLWVDTGSGDCHLSGQHQPWEGIPSDSDTDSET